MDICFFGAYEFDYPRVAVIRKGLRRCGAGIFECRMPPGRKFWLRYPLLVLRYLRLRRSHDAFFVPQFCHKDVPLVKLLAFLTSRTVIFDPLASRYETKILDRRVKSVDSPSAWWNRMIDMVSLRLPDWILADTEAHKSYYCSEFGVPESKVIVLPVGFDDDLFKPRSRVENSDFRVLFFGSFLPLHGVDVIIRAAKIVSETDPGIRFELVGSGQTHAEAQALVSELNAENVFFRSWCSLGDFPAMIARADICLGIFGHTEKARRVVPHKVYQAMAMRKPVISARTPALEEIFQHERDLVFCREPLTENLARSVLELRSNPQLRKDIAENGMRTVWDHYAPAALGMRLLDSIKDGSR